jgi:hypothetical protein
MPVELGLVKEAASAVRQPGEDKLSIVADALAVKAREQ